MLKTIFLSCVSSQFTAHRLKLKQQFADAGFELSIQDDFADAASAHGTLLKLYRFLQKADVVVQLIGSHRGNPVRYPMVEELLHVDPAFKFWLAEQRIFEDVQAGRLSYTDFESYLAIYLGKPFLPIRFEGGTPPQHEDRLKRVGRHVNNEARGVDQILDCVQEAIGNAPEVKSSAVRTVLLPSIQSSVALFVFVVVSCGIVLLLQLATWQASIAPSFRDCKDEVLAQLQLDDFRKTIPRLRNSSGSG